MTLPTLSKTFDPGDYDHLADERARIGHAKNMFAGLFLFDHDHRTWEYGVCLASLGPREAIPGKAILDVGGGYSLLGGLLTWGGANVTVNEVSDHSGQQAEMGRRAVLSDWGATPGGSLNFVNADISNKGPFGLFDAVFCVSVVEHVGRQDEFFAALVAMVAPGGVLVLTTDFHPSGQAQIGGHERCYNADMLNRWAGTPGFASPGGTDYADRGGHIFGRYNFASLHLRRAS